MTVMNISSVGFSPRSKEVAMNTKNRGRMWLILTFFALTACTGPQNQPSPTFNAGQESVVPDTPQADMPNPAAAACVEQGFVSEIRAAADGSQYGVCIFPDGSECDECNG